MRTEITCINNDDENGNPAGGSAVGTGFKIRWQNGPLGRGEERVEPNGAFVEDVLCGVLQRIEYYQEAQGGKFACEENKDAILDIKSALESLDARTRAREERAVEGTHEA